MSSFREHRQKLSQDQTFLGPIVRYLQEQGVYKSFSLEAMAVTAEGGVLVPLYSTVNYREGMPDGYLLMQRVAGAGWTIMGRFDNPEPQVL